MEGIVTEGLTKRYKDVTAVDGLDLTVRQGELFALLGVNGEGKTTAVGMLSCLVRPTSGRAYVCGISVTEDPRAVKARIGLSPQETAVAPNLTAEENLLLLARVHGLGRDEARSRTAELSEALGLGEVRGAGSGG